VAVSYERPRAEVFGRTRIGIEGEHIDGYAEPTRTREYHQAVGHADRTQAQGFVDERIVRRRIGLLARDGVVNPYLRWPPVPQKRTQKRGNTGILAQSAFEN